MIWYFCVIGLICVDFLIEYIFKKFNGLQEDKGFTSKALKFVFKYRLITILSLVVFSTFKSIGVGADTRAYFNYYQELLNEDRSLFFSPIGTRFEFGYTLFVSLLALINLPFRFLLFITSLFISIVLVIFVNKLSPNKLMSLIMYIALGTFAQSLSALRQIIAIAFIMLAIIMLVDKKWARASILIIVGALFHISAILCLVIVPLRFIKVKLWMIVGAFVLVIVGAFAFVPILKLIDKLTVLDYYTEYFVVDTQYLNNGTLLDLLYTIALSMVFIIMYIVGLKWLRLEDKDKSIYDFCLLIFAFVPLCRIVGVIVGIPQLFNRFTMYFFIALMVLIPLFAKGISHNKKLYTISRVSIYVVALVFMYYLYAIKLSCEVVPYTFL